MNNQYTLTEILSLHTVVDLKHIAKTYGLKGYSKMKKEEVLHLVKDVILDEEGMDLKFLVATDREMNALEKAIHQTVKIEEDTYEYYYWQTLGYAFITNDHEVQIPKEIGQMYQKIKNTSIYREARLRTGLINKYIVACINLYAVVEVKKLIEIINSQTGLGVDEEEILWWCGLREMLKGDLMYFYEDGYVIDGVYGEDELAESLDYKDMLKAQADKPYYVPNKSILLKYAEADYIEENRAYHDMLAFMTRDMKISKEDAAEYCEDMVFACKEGMLPSQVIQEFSEAGLIFENEMQIHAFMKYFMELSNNTRMVENRGHTPNEMRRGKSFGRSMQPIPTQGVKIDGSNVVPFPVERVSQPKVYPNDPCPCGSGKKYKKCCGKN